MHRFHRPLRILFVVLVLVTVATAVSAQFGVLGRSLPRVPAQVINPADLTAADLTWLGSFRIAAHNNCWMDGSYGRMTIRYVAGVRHLLVSQEQGTAPLRELAPCEFVDPAAYSEAGDCLTNCPSQTFATTPILAFVGNWGYDKTGANGAVYDFWHHILGKCYGTPGNGDCINNGPTVFNDCAWEGGGNCQITSMFLVPGIPDKLYFSYGQGYGAGYHGWSMGFCTLDTTPVPGVTDPVSTCYGPFRPQSTGTQTPNAAGNPTYYYEGLRACNMLLKFPDGSYGCTGSESGASYAGAYGSAGPYLFKLNALPAISDDTTYTAPHLPTTTSKYLLYYSMAFHDVTAMNYGGQQFNVDGSNPGGRPIWAYRHPLWSYMPDGTPCALNADNPIGMPPGCDPPTIANYLGNMFIDPRVNGGQSTWSDLDTNSGGVVFQGTTKQGVLFFTMATTNHLEGANDITHCTFTPAGGVLQNVAHTSYCNGQYKGASGFACSGGLDDGYGHPGDFKSPEFQCLYVDQTTGPSDTFREPAILIYSMSDLNAVAASTKTDYAVDPVARVYPLTDLSATMKFAAIGVNGVGMSFGAVAQDPNNAHVLYATAPHADSTTNPGEQGVVIHVFKIAG